MCIITKCVLCIIVLFLIYSILKTNEYKPYNNNSQCHIEKLNNTKSCSANNNNIKCIPSINNNDLWNDNETEIQPNDTSVTDYQPIIINNNNEIDKNTCSKSCCKFNQWETPINVKEPDNIIPSNFMCNHGSGSGCVCFTKDNFNLLASRGGNT